MWSRIYKFFLVCLAAILVVSVVVLSINLHIIRRSAPSIYHHVADVPAQYTALVLGARVYHSGAVSPILNDRLQTAIELYQQDKVQRLLISGDHGQTNYDEVNTMKKFLLDRGIPAEDIFLDHAGFDTYDSIYRAKEIFQADDIIIVTQAFHLPRAIYSAQQLGLPAIGIVADRQPYAGMFRNQLRESLARIKAFFNVAVKSQPKFLGEAIPIDGDSSKSWD